MTSQKSQYGIGEVWCRDNSNFLKGPAVFYFIIIGYSEGYTIVKWLDNGKLDKIYPRVTNSDKPIDQ